MLLTVLMTGLLLGAAASVPLLRWGRRLDRQRTAALEARCSLCVSALLFLMLLGLFLLVLLGLILTVPPMGLPALVIWLLVIMAIVSIRTVADIRRGGVCRWLLYSVTTIVLLSLLTDLNHRL